MAKKINRMIIELELGKDASGKVQVAASAHIGMSATEYPELSTQKGMPIVLTAAQEMAVKTFAKGMLQKIMADEDAEDGIPVPHEDISTDGWVAQTK